MISDQNISFQDKVKMILRKVACGIKTFHSIKKLFRIKTRLLFMNALVTSHLRCPAVVLSGRSENVLILLEKQQSWAIKICFNRAKFESSSDLKLIYSPIPKHTFLAWKPLCYSCKTNNQLLPNYTKNQYENYHIEKKY